MSPLAMRGVMKAKPIAPAHTLKRLYRRAKMEPGSVNGLPIPLPLSRNDLPAFTRELGFTRGAEIGVWKGAYSAQFCQGNPALRMTCVDPWVSYPAWKDTKNLMDAEKAEAFMASAYAEAVFRLERLRCDIVRKFSVDAARDVADGSLDFVYVDGSHVYEAVMADLKAWAPKVKPGGWLAGHDFRHFSNKPFVHVIEAVTDYTRDHAIAPWFVLAGDKTPSFLWVVQ